ncbi:NAD(P)H-hydrate dehydratase, partial [Burkholderia vietnamiensis]|uniref:NAD(P)H-hydrate dehydratase n=2 Tax=Burkholderia vietnamiensis TaxID=60552 RepID=UPI003D795998
ARDGACVLTPHPLEAARLLGSDTASVQHDRLAAAQALAARYAGIVVLKGSGTVIAAPDGRLTINPTGNAALATGGTGDVLGGLIGALLAQRVAPYEAALAGVYLHGLAADTLTASGTGPAGLTAGELAPMVRTLINRLFYPSPRADI